MHSFISFTESSIESLLKYRNIHSLDFDESNRFVGLISNRDKECNSIIDVLYQNGIKTEVYKDGLFFTSNEEVFDYSKNSLTIDFSFPSEFSDSNILTTMLKLFRFCIKYWGNFSRNPNEYIIPNSTKAILFPLSMSSQAYRIAIEREPNSKRIEKRFKGKHLLAYKIGMTEGAGIKEDFPYTNFNKSIDFIFNRENYKKIKDNDKSRDFINIIDLENNERINKIQLLGHKNPFSLLSEKQKIFIEQDISIPSRIEGPAGSGKTICLVLKILNHMIKIKKQDYKSLFICPSEEMVRNVKYLFDVFSNTMGLEYESKVEIKTLQSICKQFLKGNINDSELLESDPIERRFTQQATIVTILDYYKDKNNLNKERAFISERLYNHFIKEDQFSLADEIIHEMGVLIKGRCDSDLDKYLGISRPNYAIPLETEADRKFLFKIYKEYDERLTTLSQFDSDDIALATISFLNNPLWKRRRLSEGYDSIFLDETHLFNFNELSIIHYLTKDPKKISITYAIDVAQAFGDIAWDNDSFENLMGILDKNHISRNKFNTIFRCSPEIIELAHSVTSHGATLFSSSFYNPISENSFNYSGKIESIIPKYFLIKFNHDNDLYIRAIEFAEKLKDDYGIKRHDIAIIFFDRFLFQKAIDYYQANNSHVSPLLRRGDRTLISDAERKSHFIVGLAEFIGGLEFKAVLLVGVDHGRLPLHDSNFTDATKMFYEYLAHNQLYVSITRAREYVWVLGDVNRGISNILETALEKQHIELMKE